MGSRLFHALAFAILLLGAQGAPGIQSPPDRAATPEPIAVVAASRLIGQIVEAVAGDQARVTVVGGTALDAHDLEPTPADAAAVSKADLVFQLGLGFDRAVAKLHGSSRSSAKLIVLGDGLGDIELGGQDHHHGHEHGQHDPHSGDVDADSVIDPHIWHDPQKVVEMVKRATAALIAARPGSQELFSTRADALIGRLKELDQWIAMQIGQVPKAKQLIVTTHDGLAYFGRRYGIKVISIEMAGEGAGSLDPSPGQVARLVKAVRESGTPVVFADATHPSRIARTVAREAGVRVVDSLLVDSLSPAHEGVDAYLETMRGNVKAIVEALKQ